MSTNSTSLTGRTLGKYQLQEEIGRGGMGAVYKGYDPTLDRYVAVKVLAPHLLWQQGFVERFVREARAAARLQHPNIVTIYDVGEEGGWYYYVMEYLPGQTLTEVVRCQGALPLNRVAQILKPLAEALDHAHHHGLIHRDVKSGNVIVHPTGRVKLTDFGIARAAQDTRLTVSGSVVGTPEYISPEQIQGMGADARSDQYSLAVVAYEMLSGKVPFRADSLMALLYKVANEAPPPLNQARPDLPPGVESVLNRALAKEPQDRFPSVIAFAEALVDALVEKRALSDIGAAEPPTVVRTTTSRPSGRPTPGPDAPVAPPVVSGPRRWRIPRWLWAVGTTGVLLLLVGLAMARNGGQPAMTGEPMQGATVMLAHTRVLVAEATTTLPPTQTVPPTGARPTRQSTATSRPTATMTPTATMAPPPTSSLTAPTHPTTTASPTSGPAASSTWTVSPKPTATPTQAVGFSAPVLVSPLDGQAFAADDPVILQWQAVGALPLDGYYEVLVIYPHQGQVWTDETPWTKDTSWALSEHRYLLDLSDDGSFIWSVRVMQQTGTAADGRPKGNALSPSSVQRTLTWRYLNEGDSGGGSPRPVGSPTRTPPPP